MLTALSTEFFIIYMTQNTGRSGPIWQWPTSGLSTGLGPQLAKNCTWADGHWAIYSIVYVHIRLIILYGLTSRIYC